MCVCLCVCVYVYLSVKEKEVKVGWERQIVLEAPIPFLILMEREILEGGWYQSW